MSVAVHADSRGRLAGTGSIRTCDPAPARSREAVPARTAVLSGRSKRRLRHARLSTLVSVPMMNVSGACDSTEVGPVARDSVRRPSPPARVPSLRASQPAGWPKSRLARDSRSRPPAAQCPLSRRGSPTRRPRHVRTRQGHRRRTRGRPHHPLRHQIRRPRRPRRGVVLAAPGRETPRIKRTSRVRRRCLPSSRPRRRTIAALGATVGRPARAATIAASASSTAASAGGDRRVAFDPSQRKDQPRRQRGEQGRTSARMLTAGTPRRRGEHLGGEVSTGHLVPVAARSRATRPAW